MKTIKGYNGLNTFKVLAESNYGSDGNIYLVDCGDNFYGYGSMKDLQSISFVSVDRCGTKEKVIEHCNLISDMCKQNIQKYKDFISSDNSKGWEYLIQHEQEELDMLTEFARVLSV